MLDWCLRLLLLLAVPSALALVLCAQPLVATLYHYGAFTAHDVQQTTSALMGWGAGLVGVVAVKVLAPSYYASQDIKTPVRIALVVLCLTQVLNLLMVPWLAHAGLSLSIGLAALANAVLLLWGLLRRGSYRPLPGWRVFALQVTGASLLMALFLVWVNQAVDWVALRAQPGLRIAALAGLVLAAALLYLGSARALGLRWWRLVQK
jgi:putative peptidoglycan lipid II flippase